MHRTNDLGNLTVNVTGTTNQQLTTIFDQTLTARHVDQFILSLNNSGGLVLETVRHKHTHARTHARTHAHTQEVVDTLNIGAIAPTPAGPAMARPVFSVGLGFCACAVEDFDRDRTHAMATQLPDFGIDNTQ